MSQAQQLARLYYRAVGIPLPARGTRRFLAGFFRGKGGLGGCATKAEPAALDDQRKKRRSRLVNTLPGCCAALFRFLTLARSPISSTRSMIARRAGPRGPVRLRQPTRP